MRRPLPSIAGGSAVRAALLTIALASCATGPGPATEPRPASRATAAAAASPAAPQPADRLLVRTADLRLTVRDLDPPVAAVRALAGARGGYVEGEQRGDRTATLTLRVPDTALTAVLDTLARLGKVEHRAVEAEDVTEQVIDLDARLTTLVATRDRLRQLLERAGSVTDVITVERELARVQAEVESLQSRLKYLRSAAALSEVRVALRRPERLGPLGAVAVATGKLVEKLFVIR